MLPLRLRTLPARRAFSTSRTLRLDLSYQVIEPENRAGHEQPERNPIVFMHGLFGSRQNNRTISKYVFISQYWFLD